MPTYLGWDIITIPAKPSSPVSIEFAQIDAVAMNVSPFTGNQQTQNWNATRMEASVQWSNMTKADAQAWIQFLRDLDGVANVFRFSAAAEAAFPEIGSRYWRLKVNTRKWSVSLGQIYTLRFDIMEAL